MITSSRQVTTAQLRAFLRAIVGHHDAKHGDDTPDDYVCDCTVIYDQASLLLYTVRQNLEKSVLATMRHAITSKEDEVFSWWRA